MKPLRPRYSRIQREVDFLLERASISAPPIPVEDIARLLGAEIVYSDFQSDVSGLLIRRGGSAVIGVNNSQHEVRRRFTIAHEIGHLLLHGASEGEDVHIDKRFNVQMRSSASSTAEDVAEVEANAFAAALLMPHEMVRSDVRDIVIDVEDEREIRSLAQRYHVSAQAMTFRLLNLFPHIRQAAL